MMGPDGMMGPSAMMGPAPHAPATSPNIPRP
jgi:hypothetical protein